MWQEIFAWVRGCLSLGAGVLSYLYGDMNGLLVTLCVAIILDYTTGLVKAGITGTLSSEVGFRGILKKILILMVVGMAHLVDRCVGSGETWRNIAITFYICNECLSIFENAVACGIPIPEKIKSILLNIQNDDEEVDDNGSNENI